MENHPRRDDDRVRTLIHLRTLVHLPRPRVLGRRSPQAHMEDHPRRDTRRHRDAVRLAVGRLDIQRLSGVGGRRALDLDGRRHTGTSGMPPTGRHPPHGLVRRLEPEYFLTAVA
jgi:hypothetical protein